MESVARERRGTLIAGAALVVIGIAVLGVQLSGVDIGWPAWIVIPGLALFVVALAVGGQAGTGFAVLGGIVTSVGLVLAVQDATHAWASWAYAWALVAPGGVGAGLLLYGLLTRQESVARGGIGALVSGVALFLVGFLFFEGVLGLDGRPSGDLAKLVVPGALVGLGLLVILGAFLPPRWRGVTSDRQATGSGWTAPAMAATGGSAAGAASYGATGPAGSRGGWTGSADTGEAEASPGSEAGPTAGSAWAPGDPDGRAVELGGATTGEVVLAFGAGHLAVVGPAAPGHLIDGVFHGGVSREDRGAGSVRLSTPGEAFWGRVWTGTAPFEWRVGLSAEIPLSLRLEVGAARTDADLSALQLTELRVKTGASEAQIVLPGAAGYTRVEVEAGAASVRLRVPGGVAARIRSTVALGTTDVDTSRFPRDPLGGWVSPDYATAQHRVDIEVRGGVGAVAIR